MGDSAKRRVVFTGTSNTAPYEYVIFKVPKSILQGISNIKPQHDKRRLIQPGKVLT